MADRHSPSPFGEPGLAALAESRRNRGLALERNSKRLRRRSHRFERQLGSIYRIEGMRLAKS